MASKNKSPLFSFIFSKLFLKHIGIALGVFLLLTAIAFFSLNRYTQHGEYVEVPNLKDKRITEAIPMLKYMDLDYEIIDSVYISDKPAGAIIEQIPAPKDKIKKYRKVYLTINSYTKPLVTLPDVRDLSYRNAKATIEAIGLRIATVQYVPWEYKDLVKDIKKDGVILEPGARLPRESLIVLVVGRGQSSGSDGITCPSLRGLTYLEASRIANRDSLYIRSAVFTQEPKNRADSALYMVYKQRPIKGSPIYFGGSINIWLTTDKSMLSSTEEEFIQQKEDSIKKTQNKSDIEDFNF